MPRGPEIRAARVADLSRIAELDRAVFGGEAYGYACLRQLFDLAGPGALVAEDDGRVIGYGLAARAMAPEDFWFLVLGVLPTHRGRGIGTALASRIIAIADSEGAGRILLTVSPRNETAIRLYERLGFEVEGEDAAYFGAGEPRLVMVRKTEGATPAS